MKLYSCLSFFWIRDEGSSFNDPEEESDDESDSFDQE
jgi:hypothetical protein